MKKKDSKFTVINISVDSHAKIKQLAEDDKRSIRSMVEIMIEKYTKDMK